MSDKFIFWPPQAPVTYASTTWRPSVWAPRQRKEEDEDEENEEEAKDGDGKRSSTKA